MQSLFFSIQDCIYDIPAVGDVNSVCISSNKDETRKVDEASDDGSSKLAQARWSGLVVSKPMDPMIQPVKSLVTFARVKKGDVDDSSWVDFGHETTLDKALGFWMLVKARTHVNTCPELNELKRCQGTTSKQKQFNESAHYEPRGFLHFVFDGYDMIIRL